MGNKPTIIKINFESLQDELKKNSLIINTLPLNLQKCLIVGTISAEQEQIIINDKLKNDINITIVIYGANSCDDTVIDKYNQLKQLGFKNVFIYSGGLFEWLLLQDIYGKDNFETIGDEVDLLKYKNAIHNNSLCIKT
tara:strand:+ start:797 stop:1210 length:414 start_codon:yes stop_codon:yes gene_type:complete